jgi:hypothetical protein
VYGILGVYIPLSVLIIWSPLPGLLYWRLAAAPSPSVSFNGTLWCAAGFLSATAASVYTAMMKSSSSFLRPRHAAADIRGGVLAAATAYLFLSLLRRDLPLPLRLLPSVNSAAAALAALAAWFSALSLSETFGGLELFGSFTASRRGEQLREIMREYSPEMGQAANGLKNLMVSYGLQFIPSCLLLGVLEPGLIIPASGIFCGGFLILGFLSLQRRELAYAVEGISLTIRDRVLPVPVMALGITLAGLLAAAGSSDSSLFPPGLILEFFTWLGNLFVSFIKQRDRPDFAPGLRERFQAQNQEPVFPDAGEAAPWAFWKYLRYSFFAVLAFLFLLFMIYPLLRRTGFTIGAVKIRAALARWLRELKRGVSAFFSAFREKSRAVTADPEKLRGIASQLFSGVKRKDARSANLFARLILWGIETLAVPWKPSIAPGEYCALLDAALFSLSAAADVRGAVMRAGELFEKALYSGRRLSGPEEKELRLLVQKAAGETF